MNYTADPANALYGAVVAYLKASRPTLGAFLTASHAVTATEAFLAAVQTERNATVAALKALRHDVYAWLNEANHDPAKRKLLAAFDRYYAAHEGSRS